MSSLKLCCLLLLAVVVLGQNQDALIDSNYAGYKTVSSNKQVSHDPHHMDTVVAAKGGVNLHDDGLESNVQQDIVSADNTVPEHERVEVDVVARNEQPQPVVTASNDAPSNGKSLEKTALYNKVADNSNTVGLRFSQHVEKNMAAEVDSDNGESEASNDDSAPQAVSASQPSLRKETN
eukprot:GILJ01011990.1.p1 GENE.GILJ01011990.1~~GILJ01011990.1.p1  ORF type:complete len:187 (+),score=33.27 GILJ01011990.1:30-563(+)